MVFDFIAAFVHVPNIHVYKILCAFMFVLAAYVRIAQSQRHYFSSYFLYFVFLLLYFPILVLQYKCFRRITNQNETNQKKNAPKTITVQRKANENQYRISNRK